MARSIACHRLFGLAPAEFAFKQEADIGDFLIYKQEDDANQAVGQAPGPPAKPAGALGVSVGTTGTAFAQQQLY